MRAEEFVLIPKQQYMKERPLSREILENASLNAKAKQLSLLQRIPPNLPQPTLDKTAANKPSDIQQNVEAQVLRELATLNPAQLQKTNLILEQMRINTSISIGQNGNILLNKQDTGARASTLLHTLQQPTKKLDHHLHHQIILKLKLPQHLVANTYAKAIIREQEQLKPDKTEDFSDGEDKFFDTSTEETWASLK